MDSGKLEMKIKCLNAMELIVNAPLVCKDSLFWIHLKSMCSDFTYWYDMNEAKAAKLWNIAYKNKMFLYKINTNFNRHRIVRFLVIGHLMLWPFRGNNAERSKEETTKDSIV